MDEIVLTETTALALFQRWCDENTPTGKTPAKIKEVRMGTAGGKTIFRVFFGEDAKVSTPGHPPAEVAVPGAAPKGKGQH